MRKLLAVSIFISASYLQSFAQGRYDNDNTMQTQPNCPCGIGQSFNSRQNIYSMPYHPSGISVNCNNYSMLGPDYIPEGFYLLKKHTRKDKVTIYKKVAYYSIFKNLLAPGSIPFYVLNLQTK